MKKIILIVIGSMLVFGCRTLKKTSELTKVTDVKNDSTNIIEKNKPINDNLKIKIPKVTSGNDDFNNKCTEELDKILEAINASKKSGDNNYKLYYDLERRIFELQLQIAETKNQKIETNNSQSTKETEIIEKTIKRIPFWFWVVLFIWFLPQIIERVNLILNPLSKIMKLPNDKS